MTGSNLKLCLGLQHVSNVSSCRFDSTGNCAFSFNAAIELWSGGLNQVVPKL
jgi:hypothetical protein